ncbi:MULTISPECIES: 4-alpha-glucanotransferase [Frankia]|uniref:4-alpha-glucanotransferase n=1 Tax=Frankia alni (strain DSM 45986 / CECT 9034 / ACN14a) TaxID=326424 RepID=Q0RPM8_FRAAA|nr:4-alpha-glucanotransferase (Amylomaltase) (Disproportionating enzyme) (D-enzyme) [Frankia alni ACN14a]
MAPAPAALGVDAAVAQPADPAEEWTAPAVRELAELAEVAGVATSYRDAEGALVRVAPQTVRAVLRLLGIDPSDPAAALAEAREAPWRRRLPACAVVSAAAPRPIVVHLPAGAVARAELELDTGRRIPLDPPGEPTERRSLDGESWEARPLALPAGLPLGDHVLHVAVGARRLRCALVAVPDAVPGPSALAEPARAWGWMIQLYALRSASSWGMGDYADLADLADWSGRAGADVLLVNPLHAAAPTLPVAASPYSPVSRRFAAPLYLRPEATPEYARVDEQTRAAVDELARAARRDGRPDGLLDRDAVWRAKSTALELLFRAARGAADPDAVDPQAVDPQAVDPQAADTDAAVAGLADFATWCALAERHGPDWRAWPAQLAHPGTPAVAAARVELADRIAFHAWLQRRCDDQLAAAQAAARGTGMAAGIVHDLAVGVDPGGADAWALQDVLAVDATVGAPPDTFNQQGQDWGLPPWRPQALADTGYAPFRQMVAAVLRRGGGLRVDHILGLFRLWWIPSGAGAANGTYVRYDAEAMLGLVALEAARTGAVVVGEDLGTVEPSVATTLARTGVLGSTVLWFEQDDAGRPLPPARYRAATMASVTTHDLPTAAGYLEGEHVRLRAGLGLLGRSEQAETAGWRAERDALLDLLQAEGLTGLAEVTGPAKVTGPAEVTGGGAQFTTAARTELAFALHRLLVRSPCRIVLAAPGDALGDLHQPNLPGTVDAYPNWRLPVRDADGEEVTVERLRTDPAVARLGALLAEVRGASGTGGAFLTPGRGPSAPLKEDPRPTSR